MSWEREPGKRERKQPEDLTRRTAIALGVGALAAAIVGIGEDKKASDKRINDARTEGQQLAERPIRFLDLKNEPNLTYDTSELAKIKLGYPLTAYFGTSKLGQQTPINFRFNLAKMWKRKFEMTKFENDDEKRFALRAMDETVMSYDPENAGATDIGSYHEEISRVVTDTRHAFDFEKLKKTMPAVQFELFNNLEAQVTGSTLLAYLMTEIMPSGPVAPRALNTLLKTGGKEFIERIPSDADRIVSSGPYQFTKHALSEDGKKPEGASFMQKFLAKPVLPPNVISLEGSQHHQAAYLFALYNLLVLSLNTAPETAKDVARFVPSTGAVPMYIVGAHHHPASAVQAFKRYAGMYLTQKRERGILQPTRSYESFCSDKIKPYIAKTGENLAAIQSMRGKWEATKQG